jgi:hypothetical protein
VEEIKSYEFVKDVSTDETPWMLRRRKVVQGLRV